jgi:hypothetical protein
MKNTILFQLSREQDKMSKVNVSRIRSKEVEFFYAVSNVQDFIEFCLILIDD